MITLEQLWSERNINIAYRWLLSNSDVTYKNLFRDSYEAYALASGQNLKDLRKRLQSGHYQATHASKIFVPKSNGGLRQFTILTVDDQIVYQAFVNLIAESIAPKVKHRARKTVFHHLYAGKSSNFFYLKWQDSYKLYTKTVISTISSGSNWVANFDLASFYDSIDHEVIRHFLIDLNFEYDFIIFITDCLRAWTSNTWTTAITIYHGHGIPQGPFSSGMLSELVLQYIDAFFDKPRSGKYLRYVDDVKLFADSETLLREKLIALELRAREIGLFPQAAKINVRNVTNPLEEIKSVSMPSEPSVFPASNQKLIIKRIKELTKGFKVASENITRFKYVLAKSSPTTILNVRLLKVLYKHPELYISIGLYYGRYAKLPHEVASALLEFIKTNENYHAVNGFILLVALQNVVAPERQQYVEFCYDRLVLRPGIFLVPAQPSYRAAMVRWLVKEAKLTFAEFESLLAHEGDWWVKKAYFAELSETQFGPASYVDLLNRGLRAKDDDSARIAASRVIIENLAISKPHSRLNHAAKISLRLAKKLRRLESYQVSFRMFLCTY